MPDILDMPSILDGAPKFFDDLETDDKNELGNDPNFPDAVIMIDLGGNKFAAVNITTTGPDPMTVSGLVCFANDKEAELWESKWKLTGNRVSKSFQEARELAISKSNIHGLALQQNAETAHIHWVR